MRAATTATGNGAWRRAAAEWLTSRYFDISYGLLAGSVAGRRLLRQTGACGEAVHGYATAEDLDVLHAALVPHPGHRLLDLGSGVGGIARAVHRRSGAEVIGIDLSPRAVADATRHTRAAGLDNAITFIAGSISRPPLIVATNAYAIDSLMFVSDAAAAIRGIGPSLEPGGRLFATLVVLGSGGHDRLCRTLGAAGVRIERVDEVTGALQARSHARSRAARGLLREGTTTFRGRLAMLLVISEEALIQALVARGKAGRYRFIVRYR